MKIYIVTEGSYSAYHICGVFLTKNAAEIYCATMRDSGEYLEDLGIEEYDTDDVNIEVAAGTKVHYDVFVNLSEDDTAFKNLVIDDDDIETCPTLRPYTPFTFVKPSPKSEGWYGAILDTDDKDKIKKIFYDWLAQKKAEEAGL